MIYIILKMNLLFIIFILLFDTIVDLYNTEDIWDIIVDLGYVEDMFGVLMIDVVLS